MEEAYQLERRSLQRTLKGKREQIQQQHAEFWQQASAREDVDAYFYGVAEHAYPTRARWIAAETPFTHWKGPRFAESDRALLIGNRASFDIAQYDAPAKAGMSAVHLLCIPKARIFNGVSLDPRTLPIIDHMAQLFYTAWARPETRRAILRHQRETIDRQNQAVPDTQAYVAAVQHWRELENMVDKLGPRDFQFGLHLWPDHSVGHLHLHVIAAPYACRKYSTSYHDLKTKDAFEVCDYIRSMANV